MAQFRTLSAKNYDPKLRVRVQNSGRLGFGDEAATVLQLSVEKGIKFVLDDEPSTPKLYMVIQPKKDADAFEVKLQSKYYNLATMRMFDSLGVDYKNQTVFYNLIRFPQYDSQLGGEVYRMDYDPKQPNAKSDEGAEETKPDV